MFKCRKILKKNKGRVSYNDLSKATSDLIKFVSNDQKLSKPTQSTMLQWMKLLKEGIDINVKFERSFTNCSEKEIINLFDSKNENEMTMSSSSEVCNNTDIRTQKDSCVKASKSIVKPSNSSYCSV